MTGSASGFLTALGMELAGSLHIALFAPILACDMLEWHMVRRRRAARHCMIGGDPTSTIVVAFIVLVGQVVAVKHDILVVGNRTCYLRLSNVSRLWRGDGIGQARRLWASAEDLCVNN